MHESGSTFSGTHRSLGHKLGGHATLVTGTTDQNGKTVRIAVVQWQRGGTLAVVMTFGGGATAAQVAHLAALQDVKLKAHAAA